MSTMPPSGPVSASAGPVAAAAVAVGLWLGLAGFGAGVDHPHPAPTLCSSANAYLWFGGELGGRSGSAPTGSRAARDLVEVRSALDELSRSAPVRLKDEIELSQAVWTDVEASLRRHHYGAGSEDLPPGAYARLLARFEADQEKGLRLTRYLTRRCATTSTPFPTDPAGAGQSSSGTGGSSSAEHHLAPGQAGEHDRRTGKHRGPRQRGGQDEAPDDP